MLLVPRKISMGGVGEVDLGIGLSVGPLIRPSVHSFFRHNNVASRISGQSAQVMDFKCGGHIQRVPSVSCILIVEQFPHSYK